jgi:hypothetical protein
MKREICISTGPIGTYSHRGTGGPDPAGTSAGAVTRPGRQICQRRSRCRTYAGSSAARIYGRHADCRIHVGRHSSRPRSGPRDYRPAAYGLRVEKLRHLRCRRCRAIDSTAVGTFRHMPGRRGFFRWPIFTQCTQALTFLPPASFHNDVSTL